MTSPTTMTKPHHPVRAAAAWALALAIAAGSAAAQSNAPLVPAAPTAPVAPAATAAEQAAAAKFNSNTNTGPRRDSWRPGDPTTPYAEWQFPEVPHGTLWVPPLSMWQSGTTLVPSPSGDLASAAERDTLAKAQDLIKAQRHAEALALLTQAEPQALAATTALALTNLRLDSGSGDLRNPAEAMRWLQRAALRDPQFFQELGQFQMAGQHGLTADPAMAGHWWSLGLSRGCHECAGELLRFEGAQTGGLTISEDQAIAIALFGTDIGSRRAYRRLASALHNGNKNQAGTGPALQLAQQIRERARAVSGSHNEMMGGVAIALHERYRTGLVQRSTLGVLAHLAKGSPVLAVNALSLWNGGGRYLGVLLDEALSLSPAPGELTLGMNGRAWASLEALRHGQLNQGLSVALSFAKNREVLVMEGSKLVSGQQKASFSTARQAYAAAAGSGMADPDAMRAVRTELAFEEAHACWMGRYMGAHVGYGVMPLSLEEARKVMGAGTCSELEQVAIQLTGNARVLNHPPQHDAAVALMRSVRGLEQERFVEDAARAEANAARANSGPSRPSYSGGAGGANGKPMLSSAEASRRAANNVCAWSMNNSRFCK